VDSTQLYTQLLNAPPTQITAFLQGRDAVVYAATGNVGNLYSIGPGLEHTGSLDSEVLDAADFTQWGKVHLTSTLHGGHIAFETRSGNLNRPQSSWSPWNTVTIDELGGQVKSPPARFLQYRVTLSQSQDGQSPELSTVYVAYLPRNIAPKIHQIDIAPFNYREGSAAPSETSVLPSGSPTTITLPAVGQRKSALSSSTLDTSASATLQYNKGYVTVRWSASDPNGDPIIFRIEIKQKKDSRWRLLKDDVKEVHYAFDSTAFPDGEYTIRITASDAPGNTPADALTSSLDSNVFTIDNTPPEITDVAISKNGSIRALKFVAKDALSWIDKAEYSIDGGDWALLEPVNKVTDSQMLSYSLTAKAEQMIAIRIFDEKDNVVVKQFSME
jgi:hypothetical protein